MSAQLDWMSERDAGQADAEKHLRKLSRYASEAVRLEIGLLADSGIPFSADDVRERLSPPIQESVRIAPASYGALFTAASRAGKIQCCGVVTAQGRDRRGGGNRLWRGKR